MTKNKISFGFLVALLALGVFACSSDNRDQGGGGGTGASAGSAGVGVAGSAASGANASLPSTNQVIAANDTDGDGMLSPGEAASAVDNFDAVDTDGDGLLTAEEIDQAALPGGELAGEVCVEGHATGMRLAAKVVLLLDGSGSMEDDYGDTDRWSAMREAIVAPGAGVVATMEGLVEFGLVIYAGEETSRNGGGGGECPIRGEVVGPALNNYSTIENAFPEQPPGRYTPTGEALTLVCEAMPGVQVEDRPQYVILATDGQPNSCEGGGRGEVDYQSVIDAANLCCSKGVKLYVVSLASGGAEYDAHLQEIADIGECEASPGSGATVYSPGEPAQLASDLGQLVGRAMTCDVSLDGTVVAGQECQGEVLLDGNPLTCNGSDGWIMVNPSTVRLQGSACNAFQSDPDAQVTATFPCGVFVPGGGGSSGSSGGGDGGIGGGEPIF